MSNVRLAVLGAGGIAHTYHLPALQHISGAEVRVIADEVPCRAAKAAAAWGIPAWSDDPFAALVSKEIDAALILTRNDTHAPLTLAAAQAGKHVLVQKPMARSVEECEAMIAACREGGVKLMVSFMHRFLPEVEQARAYLRQGWLGEIHSVHIRNASGATSTIAPWFFERGRVGGGALMDIGVHGIDLVRFLIGEIEEIVWAELRRTRDEVECRGQVVRPDNEDWALAVYRCAAARVVHEVSWHHRTQADRFTMTIYAQRGSMLLRCGPGDLAISCDRLGAGWHTPPLPGGVLGANLHQRFIDAIRLGTEPDPGGTEGLRAVALAQEIYSRTGYYRSEEV
jgi:predicted dehydrogenase